MLAVPIIRARRGPLKDWRSEKSKESSMFAVSTVPPLQHAIVHYRRDKGVKNRNAHGTHHYNTLLSAKREEKGVKNPPKPRGTH